MSRARDLLPCLLLPFLFACRGTEPQAQPAEEGEPWAVTAWSEHYELFAETEALVAGREARSHAHFTHLPDFSALNEGSVTGILRAADGTQETFLASEPLRAGIFRVVFRPTREGTFDLAFRVENAKAREEIAAGRVRVGSAGDPGGLVEGPPGAPGQAATIGEPLGFLKEQQWRTAFATAWAADGSLQEALRAPARVRAAAGGEVTLTAPADGVLEARPWPHPGLEVAAGATLFALAPRVTPDRSRAQLEAEIAELEAELTPAEARRARLEELLALEAASPREVEEARARVVGLVARRDATRRELLALEAARGSGGGPESFRLRSPIAGRVAEVAASPGQFVAAGTALGRVVRTSPVWLELALLPAQAAALDEPPRGLLVRRWAEEEPLLVPAEALRLVSRAPEVAAGTGTVTVILAVERDVDLLRLGSRLEVEVLLSRERSGIVLPASALVDDSGVPVVYVQLGGESFERREVRVEARQGLEVLVSGVAAGERVVTVGGSALRRAFLLGSGSVEGHVH
ncbi:MAG TPA: efflux RND transporter periplasmic adaptor subunit [Thermoanaerobaculia bacterium]|nr:efflux RND transporter periplasmic adaptor subunit [Thermoanaerobaculia bacterium]